MGAQVQNGLLILAFLVIFAYLSLAEDFDEVADAVYEICGFDGLGEALLREVGEADQAVDGGRCWELVAGCPSSDAGAFFIVD